MSTVTCEVEPSYAAAAAGDGKVAVAPRERRRLIFAGAGSGRRLGGARRGGADSWYSSLATRFQGRAAAGGRGGMQVFVRTPAGKSLALDVAPSDTVDEVKAMIKSKERVAAAHQRLVFAGRHLDDGRRTLADYGVGKEATLHLLLRLRGGAGVLPRATTGCLFTAVVAVGAVLALTCFPLPPEAASGDLSGLGAAVDFVLWATAVAGVNLITAGLCPALFLAAGTGGLSRAWTTDGLFAVVVAVGAALALTCFPPEAASGGLSGLGAAVDFVLWAVAVAGVNMITAGLCPAPFLATTQSLIPKAAGFARRNVAVLAISAASSAGTAIILSAGNPALCFACFAVFLASMVLAMAVTR